MDKKWLDDIKALAFVAGLIIVLIIPDIFRVVIIPRRKYDEAVIMMNSSYADGTRQLYGCYANISFYGRLSTVAMK